MKENTKRNLNRAVFIVFMLLLFATVFYTFLIATGSIAEADHVTSQQVASFTFKPKTGASTYAKIYLTGDSSDYSNSVPSFQVNASSDATYWELDVKVEIWESFAGSDEQTKIHDNTGSWVLRCNKHEDGAKYTYYVPMPSASSFTYGYVYTVKITIWGKSNLNYSQGLGAQSYTKTFTYDCIAPIMKLRKNSSSGTVLSANADGKYYTNSTKLYVNVTESYLDYIKIGSQTVSNKSTTTISAGTYTVIAKDLASNTTSYTVICDTTAPSITLRKGSASGTMLSANADGKFYTNNTTLYIAASDSYFNTLKVGGSSQNNKSTISLTNGTSYSVVATDKAGNSTTYTVVCDTSAPAISVNAYYKAGQTVSPTITEPNISSVLLDGTDQGTTRSWATNNLSEGTHTIKVIDKAGYSTEKSFIVDKTAPTLLMKRKDTNNEFVDSAKVNSLVYFVSSDNYTSANGDFSYSIYQNQNGSYSLLSAWNVYKQGTIYFDKRDLDYSNAVYTNENIFYTSSARDSYIQSREESKIVKKTNWTTSVSGTIPESEATYATNGADYWLYTMDSGEKYIFFNLNRAKTYIANNVISKYSSSSSYFYFYEQGNFKVRVTDLAGNYTEKTFIVDLSAPTTTLVNVTNGYAKGEFSYSASDSLAGFARIEYKTPGSSTWTSVTTTSVTIQKTATNGTYTFRAYDNAGNVTSESTVVLDTTAPTVSVNAYYKAGQTVSPTISDTNFDHIVLKTGNTTVYTGAKKTWNSNDLSECKYVLTAYDKAGNTKSAEFIVDKTAPAFNVNAFYNASQTITITITESNFDSAKYDSTSLSVVNLQASIPASAFSDGSHSITVYDKAGNSTTKTFTVDKTAPAFSLNSYYKAGQTVSLSITETNLNYVAFDGVTTTARSWNTNDLSEGTHTISVYDKAGNSTTKTFVVDKTAPAFSLNAFYNASQTVLFDITEANLDYVTLDGNVVSNMSIDASTLEDGSHTVIAYDKAGNNTRKTFTVDSVAPTFSVNAYYKAGQTLTLRITEANLNYVTITSIGTTSQTQFNINELEDGEYTIKAVDLAENFTEHSFVVDKTAPEFSVKYYYNASETISLVITEANLDRVTLDGDVLSDMSIEAATLEDGSHTVIAYDKAGNSKEKSFIVDKTAPIFTLKEFYAVNETISLVIEEANLDYVTLDTVTVAVRSWDATTLSEGAHSISVFDKAGNSTTADFYFKTEQPHLSIKKNDATASSGVYLSAGDKLEVIINDDQFDYMKLDGVIVNGLNDLGNYQWNVVWWSDDMAEGTHNVTVVDLANNETSLVFSIDRTLPSLTFKVNGTLKTGYVYLKERDNISFSFSDMNFDRAELDDETTTTTQYSVAALSEYGHSFTVYDKAGNSATVEFYVDKTAPTFALDAYYNGVDDITLDIVETNFSYVTVDGNVLEGTVISCAELSENKHTVVVYDLAGNSATKSFTIDRTAPAFSLNPYYKASDVILLSVVDKNLDRVTLDGAVTSLTSWSGADLPEGEHVIVAYDKADNMTAQSFIIDTVAPEISISKNGNLLPNAVVYLNEADNISFGVREVNLDYITLNGEITQEIIFEASELEDGRYTFTTYDKAGNGSSVVFVVDKIAPSITLRKNGRTVSDGTFYKESTTASVVVTDTNLLFFTLDDVESDKNSWLASELYEGEHIIVAYDQSGNTTTIHFFIDKTAPTLELEQFYKAGQIVSVTDDVDVNFDYLTLKTGSTIIYSGAATSFNTDDLEERNYILTLYDKAENNLTLYFVIDKTAPVFSLNAFYNASETVRLRVTDNNLNYIVLDEDVTEQTTFAASNLEDGEHTVYVYDKAGNVTTQTFIVDKTAPVLYLADYYSAGKNVYLLPIDVNLDYLKLDGVVIEEGIIVSNDLSEGLHTVIVADKAGNSVTITFIVDTIAPAFSLNDFYRAIDTISLRISEENLKYVELDGLVTDLTSWQCTQLSEGAHVVKAVDFAGNVTEHTFIVDKTVPVITLENDGQVVDTSYFKDSYVIEISIEEEYINYITLNGEIAQETIFDVNSLEDGKYTVAAIDFAGNVAQVEFYVDKTAPSVTLRRNMVDIASSGVYISSFDTVSVVVDDVNVERTLFDGVETIVFSWTGSSLSDGTHTVVSYDKAGNSTTVSFIVHKSAPEFVLQEYYVLGETVVLDVSEEALDYVLLDDAETFLREWSAVDLGEGRHTLAVYDKAGNVTAKAFIVDTINPFVELTKNSSVVDGVVYAKATDIISVSVADDNLEYVLFDGEITDKRSWECVLLDEREHFITVSDKARNKTVVSFIIDRTAPAFNVNAFYLVDETIIIDVEEVNPDGVYLDGERIFVSALFANELEERPYILTAYDKAGNVTTKTFIVDLTAPILSIVGKDASGDNSAIEEGGNSYGAVNISAYDITNYTLYTSLNGSEFVAHGETFTISARAENEGEWSVYAVDNNGYTSDIYAFSVDFTAPTINVMGCDSDEARKGYTNSAFTISILDVFPDKLFVMHESEDDFSLCSQLDFFVDSTFENEGKWSFYAVDKNGLTSEVRTVVLDLGAPLYLLDGLNNSSIDRGYTNTAFSYTATDYHFAAIYYKKAGSTTLFNTSDRTLEFENTKENEGTWVIYAEDVFGQKSSSFSVTLNFTFDFKNVENIKNSFKQNTWWTVTLPSRIYSATSKKDIAGTYTFADYETALAFAVAKEKEYRVYNVTEGGYGYVSVNNENVYVTYPTEAELESAVLNYAVKYVSERKIFNKSEARNVYENLTNVGFEADVSALTLNELETPDFLEEYGLPLYFARQSFVPANNAALSPSSVTLTYIGNLTGAVEHYSFGLNYGESFSSALSRASNLYEGYYLYEEVDLCGNKQEAIIFIDLSEPTLNAHIVRGDSVEDLTVNKDAVGDRSGVFYAVSFELSELFDNADKDNLCVNIVSDKYSGTFTANDVIPTLNADFGAGTYSITVYDRSYNFLTFSVVIAGSEPSWTYTSLSASSKKLSVSIIKNDKNNALLTLRLVKILSDGTYIDLTEDSEGTVVSPANTSYVLTDGGKYSAIMTDMFGRTIQTTPIFYEKGLPSAVLEGVKNAGATNTEIKITYADVYGIKLYYVNGTKTPVSGLQPTYNAEKKQFSVVVDRTPEQDVDYLLFVYLLADEGIYIEYTFTIDCEAPLYSIEANDGSPIGANSSTNKAFFVSWLEEKVTAKVSREGYNFQNYEAGTMLDFNTLYTFSLSDRVGNESRFTVYLDSVVDFSFSADVTIKNDTYVLTKNPQTITVNEEYRSFSLKNLDGETFTQDDVLLEGVYLLDVEDRYGNSISVSIEIDTTAPTLELKNVKENGLANEDVTFYCAENTAIIEKTTARGVVEEVLKNNVVFGDEGVYYVRVTDVAGNMTSYAFTIDKTVRYTCSAENGLLTTSQVSFVFSESITQSVTLDGEAAEASLRYTAPGDYTIVLADDAGNAESISFKILAPRQQKLVVDDLQGFYVGKITLNGVDTGSSASSISLTESGKYDITLVSSKTNKSYNFSLEIDNTAPEITIEQKNGTVSFSGISENNVTIQLYRNGVLVEGITSKSSVSDTGDYVLVLTDDCGNVTTYEFEIKFRLNAISIALIVVAGVVVALLVFLFIRGRRIKAS